MPLANSLSAEGKPHPKTRKTNYNKKAATLSKSSGFIIQATNAPCVLFAQQLFSALIHDFGFAAFASLDVGADGF